MKKFIISVVLALSLVLTLSSFTACSNVDPDQGLKNKYNEYRITMENAEKTPLSYEDWLLEITKVPQDPNAQLVSAYNEYVQSMTNANRQDEALSYDNWLIYIKEVSPSANDSDLKEIYDKYTTVWGSDAVSFDDWKKAISDLGDSDCFIYIDNQGDVVAQFTNGVTKVVTPEITYKMYAKTKEGKPIANVCLAVAYYNASTGFTVEKGYTFTDSQGFASITFAPQKGITYKARIANSCPDSTVRYPVGLEPDFGIDPTFGWANTDAKFDENNEVTILFNDTRNSFNTMPSTRIPYYRYYIPLEDASSEVIGYPDDGEVQTYSETLTLDLQSGLYSYLFFEPYKTPETPSNKNFPNAATDPNSADAQNLAALIQLCLNKAIDASVGKYEITIESDSDTADVRMTYFGATSAGAFYSNDQGIPTDIKQITGSPVDENTTNPQILGAYEDFGAGQTWNEWISTVNFTNSNTLTFELNSDVVSRSNYISVYADEDCTVSITVERVGDAREVTKTYQNYEPVNQISKTADFAKNTNIALIPQNGSIIPVLNTTDGYYHVNTVDGPIIYAQLVNAVSRAGSTGIKFIPDYENGPGISAFKYTTYADEYTANSIDFYSMLFDENGYINNANSTGYYPVNTDLYTFLNYYGKSAMNANSVSDEYQWLAPCYYVVPEGGLPIVGAGTNSDPYIANLGANTLPNTTSSTFVFKVETTGWYTFVSDATITANSDVVDTNTISGFESIDNKLYAYMEKGKTYAFTATHTEDVVVTISLVTKQILATYAVDIDSNVDISTGVSFEKPLNVTGTGIYNVIIDLDSCEDGVYVNWTLAFGGAEGKYSFTLIGSDNATAVYNDSSFVAGQGETLIIEVVSGQSYNILFKNAENLKDSYMLKIAKVTE